MIKPWYESYWQDAARTLSRGSRGQLCHAHPHTGSSGSGTVMPSHKQYQKKRDNRLNAGPQARPLPEQLQ